MLCAVCPTSAWHVQCAALSGSFVGRWNVQAYMCTCMSAVCGIVDCHCVAVCVGPGNRIVG